MRTRGHGRTPLTLALNGSIVVACGVTALGCGNGGGRGFYPGAAGAQTTAPIRSANSGSVASTASATPTNTPPSVVLDPASSRQPLNVPHLLTAQLTDDGLPAGALSVTWTQVAGPSTAWIGSASATELRVGLPEAGDYVFRCEVSDGELSASAEVTVQGDAVEEVPAFPEVGFLSRSLIGEEQAKAYYDTIDPNGERDTLDGFLRANGFDQGGPDVEAVYFNAGDLGFGRAMSAKVRGQDQAYVTTNHANLDDTIADVDPIATVVMEITPGAAGGKRFTKFFVYDGDGQRITGADLDGHGVKFVPDLCISCHGGAPQPVVNGVYGNGGDLGSRLLPFDAQTFEFSNRNGFTRADQERPLKELNLAVHESPVVSERTKELIEGWYGGAAFPRATQDDDFVPSGWASDVELYLEVYAPSCRTCHAAMDAPLDFATGDLFKAYAPQIHKELEARTMPDSRRTFEAFWSSARPALLAASLPSPTPLNVPLDLPQVAIDVERRLEIDSATTLLDMRVDFAGLGDLAMRSPTALLAATQTRITELEQQRQILRNERAGLLVQDVDERIGDLRRRRDDLQDWLNDNSLNALQAQQDRLTRDWRDLLQRADRQLRSANGERGREFARGQVRADVNRLVNDLRGGVRRLERLQRAMHAA
ncbi:MAG: hypothetical protein KDD82_30875, partial [Planctomycetes bacterium]|nr:hypothetical protein [Planctomycetota bacterium]